MRCKVPEPDASTIARVPVLGFGHVDHRGGVEPVLVRLARQILDGLLEDERVTGLPHGVGAGNSCDRVARCIIDGCFESARRGLFPDRGAHRSGHVDGCPVDLNAEEREGDRGDPVAHHTALELDVLLERNGLELVEEDELVDARAELAEIDLDLALRVFERGPLGACFFWEWTGGIERR